MTNTQVRKLYEISSGMAEMARTHPNDTIANNLARVSQKVVALGTAWSSELDDADKAVIRYYMANTRSAK